MFREILQINFPYLIVFVHILGTYGKLCTYGNFWENYYMMFSHSFNMVDADRHKINCWVPKNLWQEVESLGYESPTKATIAGYEALIAKKDTPDTWEYLGNNYVDMGNNCADLGKRLDEAQNQIEELRKDKESLLNLYNNYMLQMQTLINQKAIEAPGTKKPWWRFW